MRLPRWTLPSLPALALLFCAAGCAHSAPPRESRSDRVARARAAADAIVLCRTTEAELRRELGEPTRNGRLHGQRILSWIVQWDAPARYFAVLVDDRGIVIDAYWDVPTEIPWVPVSQCGR